MNKFSIFLCTALFASAFVQAKAPIPPVQADIFYEIACGNKKSIKTWLKSSPDLAIRNAKGQSVLTAAAVTVQRDLVKMFVKAGAVVNAVDMQGKTALDHAIEFGHVKMVCDLVKHGGKVTTSDNLYHLKSVMKDRSFSLFLRFGLLFLVGGVVFMPAFFFLMLPLIMFDGGLPLILPLVLQISASALCLFGGITLFGYAWSLPCRAYSWNKASNQNWMLSTGTVSLN